MPYIFFSKISALISYLMFKHLHGHVEEVVELPVDILHRVVDLLSDGVDRHVEPFGQTLGLLQLSAHLLERERDLTKNSDNLPLALRGELAQKTGKNVKIR